MSPDSEVIRDWARLGVLWNTQAAAQTPDIEPLLMRSLPHVPANPRLLVLACSWLKQYWRCVGRDRLRQFALPAPVHHQAILGLVLQTVDTWLGADVFAAVRRPLRTPATPEPLLVQDRATAALARLAQQESSDMARSWGLFARTFDAKPEAIRPAAWIMEHNPVLLERALFKGTLKTSLLAIFHAGGDTSTSGLARACGVTRKAVYDALADLRFCQLVPHGRAIPA